MSGVRAPFIPDDHTRIRQDRFRCILELGVVPPAIRQRVRARRTVGVNAPSALHERPIAHVVESAVELPVERRNDVGLEHGWQQDDCGLVLRGLVGIAELLSGDRCNSVVGVDAGKHATNHIRAGSVANRNVPEVADNASRVDALPEFVWHRIASILSAVAVVHNDVRGPDTVDKQGKQRAFATVHNVAVAIWFGCANVDQVVSHQIKRVLGKIALRDRSRGKRIGAGMESRSAACRINCDRSEVHIVLAKQELEEPFGISAKLVDVSAKELTDVVLELKLLTADFRPAQFRLFGSVVPSVVAESDIREGVGASRGRLAVAVERNVIKRWLVSRRFRMLHREEG